MSLKKIYLKFEKKNPFKEIFGEDYPHDHICVWTAYSDGYKMKGLQKNFGCYKLYINPCSKDSVYDGQQLWSMDIGIRCYTGVIKIVTKQTSEMDQRVNNFCEKHSQNMARIYLSVLIKYHQQNDCYERINEALNDYIVEHLAEI